MKSILIVLVIIIIGGAVWYGIQTKPDASVPTAVVSDVNTTSDISDTKPIESTTPATTTKMVDNANVKIAFKGFGPGKVHNGSFGKIDSKLSLDSTGNLKGEVVVDMTSLTTDNSEKLTPHLKSDAFFDVAKYPTAKFSPKILEGAESGEGFVLSGSLTVKGITKNIIIPANLSDKSMSYTTTFNINMKEFGIDQTFANEVVEVTVTVPLK